MRMTRKILLICLITSLLSGCIPDNIKEQANQKFGDQHFKTAIALIELHNIRLGQYPESLDQLKYLGDWDQIIFQSVKYTKLQEGYSLDLVSGWIGKPEDLNYPAEFWE